MKCEYRKHIDRMFNYAIKATSLQEVFDSMMNSICEDDLYDFIDAYCDECDCCPPDED